MTSVMFEADHALSVKNVLTSTGYPYAIDSIKFLPRVEDDTSDCPPRIECNGGHRGLTILLIVQDRFQ